jgi:hypothetical protein
MNEMNAAYNRSSVINMNFEESAIILLKGMKNGVN